MALIGSGMATITQSLSLRSKEVKLRRGASVSWRKIRASHTRNRLSPGNCRRLQTPNNRVLGCTVKAEHK
jgi:hypothetical protein